MQFTIFHRDFSVLCPLSPGSAGERDGVRGSLPRETHTECLTALALTPTLSRTRERGQEGRFATRPAISKHVLSYVILVPKFSIPLKRWCLMTRVCCTAVLVLGVLVAAPNAQAQTKKISYAITDLGALPSPA